MNIRQIKLALTVGLLNSQSDNNALNLVKELMLSFQEVGNFLGLRIEKEAALNRSHVQQTYACSLKTAAWMWIWFPTVKPTANTYKIFSSTNTSMHIFERGRTADRPV